MSYCGDKVCKYAASRLSTLLITEPRTALSSPLEMLSNYVGVCTTERAEPTSLPRQQDNTSHPH